MLRSENVGKVLRLKCMRVCPDHPVCKPTLSHWALTLSLFHIYQCQGDFETKTLGRVAPRGGRQDEVHRKGMPEARASCFCLLHDNHPQLRQNTAQGYEAHLQAQK